MTELQSVETLCTMSPKQFTMDLNSHKYNKKIKKNKENYLLAPKSPKKFTQQFLKSMAIN